MFKFSKTSRGKLVTVKPPLQLLVEEALSYGIIDITVAEGIRTEARQEQLVKEGLSKTMKSKHLTGDAVDIYPYVSGHGMINKADTAFERECWAKLSTCMKIASKLHEIPIEWGGDWKSFKDYPHFQLT